MEILQLIQALFKIMHKIIWNNKKQLQQKHYNTYVQGNCLGSMQWHCSLNPTLSELVNDLGELFCTKYIEWKSINRQNMDSGNVVTSREKNNLNLDKTT